MARRRQHRVGLGRRPAVLRAARERPRLRRDARPTARRGRCRSSATGPTSGRRPCGRSSRRVATAASRRARTSTSAGATGVGPVPRNQVGVVRASSLVTYLAEARERPNLTILANSTVTRVLFEGTKAVGVEYERDGARAGLRRPHRALRRRDPYAAHPAAQRRRARRRAVHYGIEPVVISEGVGQNLQDHPFVPLLMLLKERTENVGVRAELKFTTESRRTRRRHDALRLRPGPGDVEPGSRHARARWP